MATLLKLAIICTTSISIVYLVSGLLAQTSKDIQHKIKRDIENKAITKSLCGEDAIFIDDYGEIIQKGIMSAYRRASIWALITSVLIWVARR